MYRTYLSTLSHKRLSEKKEDHHGEAVCQVQLHGYFKISFGRGPKKSYIAIVYDQKVNLEEPQVTQPTPD
jgi:hypothetical protein